MDSFVPRRAEIAIPDRGGEALASIEATADESEWVWICADRDLELLLNHYLALDTWFKEYAPDKFGAMVRAVAEEFKARVVSLQEPDLSTLAPDRVY